MKKHFYSHIVETESIEVALVDVDMSEQERKELLEIAHASLHHTVVDTILSELSSQDKDTFLEHLGADKHEAIWDLLKNKIVGIEEKIKKAAENLKDALHRDIQVVKKSDKTAKIT